MASKDAALPASMDQSLHACRGEMASPSERWFTRSWLLSLGMNRDGWMFRWGLKSLIVRGVGSVNGGGGLRCIVDETLHSFHELE
jgi:hypothetical protein